MEWEGSQIQLVGHLTGISQLIHEWQSATYRLLHAGSGAAEWMTASVRSVATSFAFASPFERRGIGIPGARGLLQPVDDLHGVGRRLTGQSSLGDNHTRLLRFDATADFDAAARIYRRCRAAGFTPHGMVDCMIAAVAWRHGASLLAHDVVLQRLGQIVGIKLDQASLAT